MYINYLFDKVNVNIRKQNFTNLDKQLFSLVLCSELL